MSKVLEKEFNLPSLEEILEAAQQTNDIETDEENSEETEISESENEMRRVANALAHAEFEEEISDGVEDHADEADDIYKKAIKAFEKMMDLGMNIEPKNAGANAFAPATKFLEIALKASRSKADKKTERMRLAMDKEKQDHELGKHSTDGEINGDLSSGGVIAYRGDIIDKIKNGEFDDIE